MKTDAKTVDEYLSSIAEEQRTTIALVRKFLLERMPEGIAETIRWGMISYEIPLSRFPDTYNGKPLLYAALAAQKRYNSLYLLPAYLSEENKQLLVDSYARAGKTLSMGKSCIRFRSVTDLVLPIIGEMLQAYPVDRFVVEFEKRRKES
jgi:hypothetical protein